MRIFERGRPARVSQPVCWLRGSLRVRGGRSVPCLESVLVELWDVGRKGGGRKQDILKPCILADGVEDRRQGQVCVGWLGGWRRVSTQVVSKLRSRGRASGCWDTSSRA